MPTSYPAGLDSFPLNTDNVDDVLAADVNNLQDAIAAIETKLGINSSAVVGTIDYLLNHAGSINPGHQHTDASLSSLAHGKITYGGLTAGHALMASGAAAASFRAIQEGDLVNGALLARVGDTETVTGAWTFNGTKPKFKQGIELQGAGSESVTHAAASGAGTVSYTWPSAFTNGQYLQVGAGGALSWATPAGGGTGGWQDDGTVIRPSALGDQVGIGTASPVANTRVHINAQAATDILLLLRHAASPSANYFEVRRSDDTVVAELSSAGTFKLKNTQALTIHPGSAGTLLGYSNASSGYLGIACDTEANLLTGNQLAAKFFSDTTVFFGTLAASQGSSGGQVTVRSGAVGRSGLIVRAMTSQTANLLEFQSSVPAALGSVSVAGLLTMPNVTVSGGGALRLNGGTSGFSAFTAAPSGANVTYTLPAADGSSGQVLGTNGAGALSWVSGSGGSATLSTLTAAGAANSINNGVHAQIWAWALGATGSTALTITENVAASAAARLLKVRTITGSTATALEVGSDDMITGAGFYVNGGSTIIKSKYIRIGSTASTPAIYGPAGAGVSDAVMRFEGNIECPILAAYPEVKRLVGISTAGLEYKVPKSCSATNLDPGLVYFALHCKYSTMDPARDVSSGGGAALGGHDVYAVDETLDGFVSGEFRTAILRAEEINYNDSNFRAARGEIVYMTGTNFVATANAAHAHNIIHFWIRDDADIDPTAINQTGQKLNANAYSRLTGLQTSPTHSSVTTERQWRPLYFVGHTGRSYHAPRMQFGGLEYSISGGPTGASNQKYFIAGCNLTGDLDGLSTTPLPAAVTVFGFHTQSDTANHNRSDKYILLGAEEDLWNATRAPRVAFYRLGGMRLWAHATPVEAVLGGLYVDGDDNKLYFHNGTSWIDLTNTGGGGGGLTDDGTIVRMTTASDRVILGAATTTIATPGTLSIVQNTTTGDRPAITGVRKDSYASHFLSYFKEDQATRLALINYNGAFTCTDSLSLNELAGNTTQALLTAYTDGVRLLLGGTGSIGGGITARNYISIKNGVVPDTSPADCAILYAKDAAAGKSWFAFRAEDAVERFVLGIVATNTGLSSGAGSVKMTGATARDNVGWMQTHDHQGNTIYVPYWTTIS